MLGYLPVTLAERPSTLARKRAEYLEYRTTIYENKFSHQTEKYQKDLKQIHDDIPRTQPEVLLFRTDALQCVLGRVLYIWSVRHPASGYVQGINDLCSILLLVLLEGHTEFDLLHEAGELPECMDDVEADAYWCLAAILECIQDYFFPCSPGIQRALGHIQEIIWRLDAPLARHLEALGVQLIHFSFRWFNCMFTREFPLQLVFLLWDALISCVDGFSQFSVYVASAFILHYAKELKQSEFNEVILMMQNLPTANWRPQDLEGLVSTAFVHYTWFHNSPSHLKS